MKVSCHYCGCVTKPFAYKGKQYCEIHFTMRVMADRLTEQSDSAEVELEQRMKAKREERIARRMMPKTSNRGRRRKENTYIEVV